MRGGTGHWRCCYLILELRHSPDIEDDVEILEPREDGSSKRANNGMREDYCHIDPAA